MAGQAPADSIGPGGTRSFSSAAYQRLEWSPLVVLALRAMAHMLGTRVPTNALR